MRQLLGWGLILSTLASAGCPVVAVTSTAQPSQSPLVRKPAVTSVVTGRLIAPANVIASDGAGVIASDGAGILSSGKVQVIASDGAGFSARRRAVLQAQETRIAGAEVYLADASGAPVPNLGTVKTDAQGHYTIPHVPAGFSFLVVATFTTAGGKPGRFTTLVTSSQLGATAHISGDSTLAATAVTEGLSGALGEYNQATFARAIALTRQNAQQQPDWTDLNAVARQVQQLTAAVADLRQVVDALKAELRQVKQGLADLQAEVEKIKASAPPSLAPTPTPSPSPLPSTAPSVLPSPSPTASAVRAAGDLGRMTLTDPRGDTTTAWTAASLTMTVKPGKNYWVPANLDAPRYTLPVEGDFDLRTRVQFVNPKPGERARAAGLFLDLGGGAWVRFEHYLYDSHNYVKAQFVRGTTVEQDLQVGYDSFEPVTLRIVRDGGHFACTYYTTSIDDAVLVRTHEWNVPARIQAGVIIVNERGPDPVTATFDQFTLQALPTTP